MKLKEWMEKNNKSVSWVAERLERSESTIRSYMKGKRKPKSNDLCWSIVAMTNGQVTHSDFWGRPVW